MEVTTILAICGLTLTPINGIVSWLAETVPNYSTMNWLANVSPTGTFTKSPNMSLWIRGSSGIPDGWTIQDYAG